MNEWISWDIGYKIGQEITIFDVKYMIWGIENMGDAVKLKIQQI